MTSSSRVISSSVAPNPVVELDSCAADGSAPRLDLEVVIPVYNEERRIHRSLLAICARLDTMTDLRCGIIVVDNGSADRTAELVDLFADHAVVITVIGCSTGGKGAAIRKGVRASTAGWVGFCDADLATPVEALDQAVALLRAGRSVVVGSRRAAGAEYVVPQPRMRRAGGWMFRRSTRSLAGDVRDTQCGFKFFTQEVAQQLFGAVTTAGFTFDVELLALARVAGIPVTELPVSWCDQDGSSLSPFRHGGQIVREIRHLHRLGLTAAPLPSTAPQARRRPAPWLAAHPSRELTGAAAAGAAA